LNPLSLAPGVNLGRQALRARRRSAICGSRRVRVSGKGWRFMLRFWSPN